MAKPKSVQEALRKLSLSGLEGEEAYEFLYQDGTKVLHAFLRKLDAKPDDAEDIIQKVFFAVLQRRLSAHFAAEGQWYFFLKRSARNALIDLLKASKKETSTEVDFEDPSARTDEAFFDRVREKGLYRVADLLWLGSEPTDYAFKLNAATLLYIKGKEPGEVFRFIAASKATQKPDSPEALWDWVSHKTVLRQVAYNALYRSNDQLAAQLLDTQCEDLKGLWLFVCHNPPDSQPVKGWLCWEVEVILRRYRNGDSLSKVCKDLTDRLDDTRISAVCDRCRASFPFVKVMTGLLTRLHGHPLKKETLSENDLWKRLVFQYYYANRLIQDDVKERVTSAAEVAGYSLNNVNQWTGGRFAKEIRDFLGVGEA